MNRTLGSEWNAFAVAVRFLTRVPIPGDAASGPEGLAAGVRYYALVGALIGVICAGVFGLALLVFPGPVAIVLAIAAGPAITGAFHEDGLADTFDGIGAGAGEPQRALEIMRDSRLGTYGTVALIAALALKFAALAALSPVTIGVALVAGHGLSRLSGVIVMQTSGYVRDAGAATPVADRLAGFGWLVMLVTAALLVAGLAVFLSPFAAMLALAGLGGGHVLTRLYFEPRLKGYTGDTLGAVQQASEIGLYLGLAAWA